jgi:hypothetical protein
MTIRFSVDRWAAWAPTLSDQASWRVWLENPSPLPSDNQPALSEMPAMMRRRLNPLGRAALQAAYWCQADTAPCPVVFGSRYGDIGLSVELLRELASAAALSPTAFSLSVHNAIAALYSIARGDTGNYAAVAAGEETVEAAFTEAVGLLADQAPAVMVVYYDEPVVEPFRRFRPDDDFPRAWACRLTRADRGACSLRASTSRDATATNGVLPADLAVLHFLVSGAARLERRIGQRAWRWQRHD